MNNENKTRIIYGIKMLALVLYIILTIITCAGVWNYNPEGFVKWCAFALAICNGILSVKYFLRLRKEYKDYIKALTANQLGRTSARPGR